MLPIHQTMTLQIAISLRF